MKNRLSFSKHKMLVYGLQSATLAVLATAAVCIFTLTPNTISRVSALSWHILLLPLLLIITSWLCTGGRIWLLSHSLGHRLRYGQTMSIALSAEFGIAASPAGLGGAAIRLALLNRAGVPVTTGTSMMATDAVVDVIFFSLLIPYALMVIIADPTWQPLIDSIAVFPFSLLLLCLSIPILGCLVVFNKTTRLWVLRKVQMTSFSRRYRLASRIRLFQLRLRRTVKSIRTTTCFLFRHRRRTLFLNLLLASGQWIGRYAVLPVLLMAFSSPRNSFPLFFIQGALFMLSIFLVLPGGGGGIELLTPIVLNSFLPLSVVGVVLILWRFFTFHLYLIVGGATFFFACNRLDRFRSSS